MANLEVSQRWRKKLDTFQAAEYLGLGKSTLDKLRVVGGGPSYLKVGARVLYDPIDLDDWVAQFKRANTSVSSAV